MVMADPSCNVIAKVVIMVCHEQVHDRQTLNLMIDLRLEQFVVPPAYSHNYRDRMISVYIVCIPLQDL